MINHFFQKMLLAFLATRALSLPERSSHLLERASHVNGVRPVGLIDRKQPHEQEREKTTILSSPTGTPAWNRGIAPPIALD